MIPVHPKRIRIAEINTIIYTKPGGQPQIRRIIPIAVEYGTSPDWRDIPQWSIFGFDSDKQAFRTFPLNTISFPTE
jgi:hypothetical protein